MASGHVVRASEGAPVVGGLGWGGLDMLGIAEEVRSPNAREPLGASATPPGNPRLTLKTAFQRPNLVVYRAQRSGP